MILSEARKAKNGLTLRATIRLYLRSISRRGKTRIPVLDPRYTPEHQLKDIGLASPSEAWGETIGFWR